MHKYQPQLSRTQVNQQNKSKFKITKQSHKQNNKHNQISNQINNHNFQTKAKTSKQTTEDKPPNQLNHPTQN